MGERRIRVLDDLLDADLGRERADGDDAVVVLAFHLLDAGEGREQARRCVERELHDRGALDAMVCRVDPWPVLRGNS